MCLYDKSILLLMRPQLKLLASAHTHAWHTCIAINPLFVCGFTPSLALKTLLSACTSYNRCCYHKHMLTNVIKEQHTLYTHVCIYIPSISLLYINKIRALHFETS